MKNLSFSKY